MVGQCQTNGSNDVTCSSYDLRAVDLREGERKKERERKEGRNRKLLKESRIQQKMKKLFMNPVLMKASSNPLLSFFPSLSPFFLLSPPSFLELGKAS